MVTVVQQPSNGGGDSGMGFLIGVILLIVVVLGVIYYGIPLLNRTSTTPQINVPGKIDVNVNQGK